MEVMLVNKKREPCDCQVLIGLVVASNDKDFMAEERGRLEIIQHKALGDERPRVGSKVHHRSHQ